MLYRSLAILFVTVASLCAHPQVSPLVVEAEFDAQHQITLRVNLDPRLLFSDQPSSLPVMNAAWYLDQNEAARAKTAELVKQYLRKTLAFKLDANALEPKWEISAIDGASNLPLAATSAETHLLASFNGKISDKAEQFKLSLDPKCVVELILLNSYKNKEERIPQALFPGESSRPFPTSDASKASSKN